MNKAKTSIYLLCAIFVLVLCAFGLKAKAKTTLSGFVSRAKEVSYKSPEELQAQHEREMRKGKFYAKLPKGNPNIKAVALTFDDGPHPMFTPQLLKILKRYNISATFFVIGKMAKQYPDLIKQEYAAGHAIGNHTYNHLNMTKIPINQLDSEWGNNNKLIKSIIGLQMQYCRPPGGDYDEPVIKSAMKNGLTTVLWTDDPGDYANPGDKTIETRVFERIRPGGIILLHDGVQETVNVLPQIIEHIISKGYKFQTVYEMADDTLPKGK